MTFEEVNFTFKFQPGIFVSGHDTDRIGRKHNLQDANVKKNVNLHTLIHNTNVTTFLVETCTPFQSDWNGTARFFAAHHHIHNNIAVHVSRRKWAIMQLFRYNDRLLSLLQNPLFTLRFVVLTVVLGLAKQAADQGCQFGLGCLRRAFVLILWNLESYSEVDLGPSEF